MEKDKGYYEAPEAKPEDVPSLYAEMYRSRDYGDARVRPDDAELRSIGSYWTAELNSEYRSPRARKEIDLLLGRISFELVMRQNELLGLENASRIAA